MKSQKFTSFFKKIKNDNTHKSEAEEIRQTNKHLKVQSGCIISEQKPKKKLYMNVLTFFITNSLFKKIEN